jgi:hypothetical protein
MADELDATAQLADGDGREVDGDVGDGGLGEEGGDAWVGAGLLARLADDEGRLRPTWEAGAYGAAALRALAEEPRNASPAHTIKIIRHGDFAGHAADALTGGRGVHAADNDHRPACPGYDERLAGCGLFDEACEVSLGFADVDLSHGSPVVWVPVVEAGCGWAAMAVGEMQGNYILG